MNKRFIFWGLFCIFIFPVVAIELSDNDATSLILPVTNLNSPDIEVLSDFAPVPTNATDNNLRTPLTGYLTIGPSGNYTSFTAAINALNTNGVGAGGVTFTVSNGTYNENPPPITATGSSTQPVNFVAAYGANPVLYASGGTGTYGFKLVGVDYISFDNIDVRGPASLYYGYWLIGLSGNGASFNSITNCAIYTDDPSTNGNYAIYCEGVQNGPNNMNYFGYNTVNNFNNGITVRGFTLGHECYGNTIEGNVMSNLSGRAFFHAWGNSLIESNQVTFRSASTEEISCVYAAGNTSYLIVENNVFSSGNVTGQNIYGLYHNSAGITDFGNNQLLNFTQTSGGGFCGCFVAGGSVNLYSNTINNISVVSANFVGIWLSTGTHGAEGNTISNVTTTGVTARPIYVAGGIDHTIQKNKIYNITCQGSAGTGYVYGMDLAVGLNIKVFNNMVWGLNSGGTSIPQIMGIRCRGNASSHIWNNTVYLNSSSEVLDLTTIALSLEEGSFSDIRNNIFVNKSVPGTGTSYAVKIDSLVSSILDIQSNKNIYYAGSPNDSHCIAGYLGTKYQTLESYKNTVEVIDQGSYTEDVPFISPSGTINLHLNPTVTTWAEGNALVISDVTYDFDGQVRHTTNPDIGVDEGNFTGYNSPPGLVTLQTPANNANDLSPLGLTVTWREPRTGGTTRYYTVYVSDSPATIFSSFYVNVPAPANSFNLDEMSGLNLGYNNTWYWAVRGFNIYGGSNEFDPEFMIYSFTTIPRIVANASLELGYVLIGTEAEGELTVRNNGTATLIFNLSGPAEFDFGSLGRYSVPPGNQINIPYVFSAPSDCMSYLETITLQETSPETTTILINANADIIDYFVFGTDVLLSLLPVMPTYNYSYSQTIYEADWFDYSEGFWIEKISYYYPWGYPPEYTSDFKIWMGHTTLESFNPSGNSWLPVSGMTLVFDGVWDISYGWSEITLQTPFAYNRTDNLVIAVDENTPGRDSNLRSFHSSTNSLYISLYHISNVTNLDPTSPQVPPSSSLNYPNTRFTIAPISNPPLSFPFFEDWSSLSLDTHHWTADSDNWHISESLGYPAPGIVFTNENITDMYDLYLTSHDIDATGQTEVLLRMFINMSYSSLYGSDYLSIEIWNGSLWQEIYTFGYYDFYEPKFIIHDISSLVAGNIFKIRFRAYGNNYNCLNYWLIDNIRLKFAAPYLEIPQNFNFSIVGSDAVVSWDEVNDADWYGFYISNDLSMELEYSGHMDGSITSATIPTFYLPNCMFFQMTAGSGMPPEVRTNHINPPDEVFRKFIKQPVIKRQ